MLMGINVGKTIFVKLTCATCGKKLYFGSSKEEGNTGDEYTFSPEPCETCIATAIADAIEAFRWENAE